MKRTLESISQEVSDRLSDSNVAVVSRQLWWQLQKQKKFGQLDKVIELIEQKQAEKHNCVSVIINSVIELNDADKEKLGKKLEKKLGQKIIARYRIDPKVLGGMKIQIGDTIFDLTLKDKIEQIKAKLRGSNE